jgi:hypothetical protein
MAVGWMAAAAVFGAMGAMGLGLALLVWLASHAAAGVLGVLAAGAVGLAVAGVRRGRARGAEASEALERAWVFVAGDVVRARGADVTAHQLASAMGTDEEHAQTLLTRLSAAGHVRVEVRDDAELAYRADPGDEPAAEPEEDRASKGLRTE